MIVTGLLGHVSLHQPARRLEVEHEYLRLHQRGLHPLPLAGAFAFKQRHQNRLGAEQPGAEIGDRNANPHRPLAGLAGDRHQPAHALRDLIKPRPVAIRPLLPKSGDGGIDQPFVERFEAFIVDTEAVFHGRAEILHHHIGLGGELLKDFHAVFGFEIERQATLVALQVLKIRSGARAAHGAFIVAARYLDLDDIGTPVGELAHASGTRAHPRQIEHAVRRQGGACGIKCHLAISPRWICFPA